jgi:hypothetical protein
MNFGTLLRSFCAIRYVYALANDEDEASKSSKKSAKSKKRAGLKRQRTEASPENDNVNAALDRDSSNSSSDNNDISSNAVRDIAMCKFPLLQNIHFRVKEMTEIDETQGNHNNNNNAEYGGSESVTSTGYPSSAVGSDLPVAFGRNSTSPGPLMAVLPTPGRQVQKAADGKLKAEVSEMIRKLKSAAGSGW